MSQLRAATTNTNRALPHRKPGLPAPASQAQGAVRIKATPRAAPSRNNRKHVLPAVRKAAKPVRCAAAKTAVTAAAKAVPAARKPSRTNRVPLPARSEEHTSELQSRRDL